METKPLQSVPGWREFQKASAHIKPQSYHFNVSKFSHKVYAQLDAFESDHRYVVWLDADIVFLKKITQRFLKNLLNEKMCAFLGRRECYTETGFLIFDTEHEDFPAFKEEYANYYNKQYIYECKCWIDCCAFDGAKKFLDCENLTPQAHGMIAVFDISPLAPYMQHDKGNLKYGRKHLPTLSHSLIILTYRSSHTRSTLN